MIAALLVAAVADLREAGAAVNLVDAERGLPTAFLAFGPACDTALVCDGDAAEDVDDEPPASDGSALATADVVKAATPNPRPTVSAVPHEADLLDPIDFRPNLSTRVCAPMRAG